MFGKESAGGLVLDKKFKSVRITKEMGRKIESFPVLEMTKEQFNRLPKTKDLSAEYLKNEATVGFRFIFSPSENIPLGAIVMGEIIRDDSALADKLNLKILDSPKKIVACHRIRIKDKR